MDGLVRDALHALGGTATRRAIHSWIENQPGKSGRLVRADLRNALNGGTARGDWQVKGTLFTLLRAGTKKPKNKRKVVETTKRHPISHEPVRKRIRRAAAEDADDEGDEFRSKESERKHVAFEAAHHKIITDKHAKKKREAKAVIAANTKDGKASGQATEHKETKDEKAHPNTEISTGELQNKLEQWDRERANAKSEHERRTMIREAVHSAEDRTFESLMSMFSGGEPRILTDLMPHIERTFERSQLDGIATAMFSLAWGDEQWLADSDAWSIDDVGAWMWRAYVDVCKRDIQMFVAQCATPSGRQHLRTSVRI